MSQASNLIILFAFSILISYLGGILYTRTKIPDIIWLLGFGVLIGPVLGIIPPKLLNTFAPLAGVVSVTLITFEAGMSTNLLTLTEIIGSIDPIYVLGSDRWCRFSLCSHDSRVSNP